MGKMDADLMRAAGEELRLQQSVALRLADRPEDRLRVHAVSSHTDSALALRGQVAVERQLHELFSVRPASLHQDQIPFAHRAGANLGVHTNQRAALLREEEHT